MAGRFLVRIWIGWTVVATIVLSAGPLPAQTKVEDLKVFCREGQTFITFKELDDVKGEKYAIYHFDGVPSEIRLTDARKLAVIGEDSGAFKAEQRVKRLAAKTKVAGYNFRFIIQDNPTNDPKAQLPAGVGLFVYTVKADGDYSCAVVPVIDGKQVVGRMSAIAPVKEKVALPGAVLVWKSPGGAGAVYTHWMDGATWDPMSEGNAYNFGIGVPKKYDGKTPLPVMFYGHGMGGTYRAPDDAPYTAAVWIWHGDKSGSWFLGMMNRAKTKVVNYAEQRVRWSAGWLGAGRKNQFWKADMTRVNAHGHSMGGTGCKAWALRLGDIFCTTVDSAGATIHHRNRTWVNQASKLWGPVDKNLPMETRTYDYSAGKLTITRKIVGGVWDYQNYAKWSLDNMATESAWFTVSHGQRDGSVVFEPVPDFLAALQKSKRPFAAVWNQRGHSWSGYGTRNNSWGAFKIRIDETVPALANASNNDDPRKTKSGQINGKLEWSAPGNDFDAKSADDDIVDTAATWAMNIRSLSGPATVDVTPRRCKRFKPAPGAKCTWQNLDFSNPAKPKVVDRGTVAADKYGLVTVEKFKVGKAGLGNRLVIKAAK
ncbi:hypothetical protein LCGC14_1992790 [marine sediment metagenome]|uniref:Peptidase S9 prolyl oligopeptidase catalytic domain-containing protein n=1 Tax=marine sediment metagenome TaxID=412755 RepID=A0A0F9F5B9_9ZZZZ